VSARHQVKRLDRTFEAVNALEAGPAEETSFLRSVRVLLKGPQFHQGFLLPVESGPDVFADALVPPFRADEPGIFFQNDCLDGPRH